MSEIVSENSELRDVAFASDLLRTRVSPPLIGSVKSRINSAARRLKWSASRVKDVWYQDARLIRACEMDRLKAVARVSEDERETAETIRSIARLAARLASVDAEFHGPEIDRLRALAVRLGRVDD
jgi:hypothetical protein